MLVPSAIVIGYEPLPENGTLNVTLTSPVDEVVPPLTIEAAVLPKVTVKGAEEAKSRPVIVTFDPTAPLVGLGALNVSSTLADCCAHDGGPYSMTPSSPTTHTAEPETPLAPVRFAVGGLDVWELQVPPL